MNWWTCRSIDIKCFSNKLIGICAWSCCHAWLWSPKAKFFRTLTKHSRTTYMSFGLHLMKHNRTTYVSVGLHLMIRHCLIHPFLIFPARWQIDLFYPLIFFLKFLHKLSIKIFYPVFRSNCNQQKMYCARTTHTTHFEFALSDSILLTVFSCKISAL